MRATMKLLLPLLLPLTGSAQPGGSAMDGPAAESPPRYRVEVLVFAHQSFDPSEEAFRHKPPSFDPGTAPASGPAPPAGDYRFTLESLEPSMPGADGTAAPGVPAPQNGTGGPQADGTQPEDRPPPLAVQMPAGSSGIPPEFPAMPSGSSQIPSDSPPFVPRTPRATPFRFSFLSPEEFELGGAYAAIDRVGAYAPLVHGGWIQAGLSEDEARPFNLAHLGVLNPSGTIRLHVSRFLHLTLDLSYQRAATPAATVPAGGRGSAGLGSGLREIDVAPRYRLQTSRRIRSGELHYFDHPAFGVLIMVRPQPEEEAAAGDTSPAA